MGPARWKAWLKFGLYIAVGAPPLATPFTADELTIVVWLKNENEMRISDKRLARASRLVARAVPPPSYSVKDAYPFLGAAGEFCAVAFDRPRPFIWKSRPIQRRESLSVNGDNRRLSATKSGRDSINRNVTMNSTVL